MGCGVGVRVAVGSGVAVASGAVVAVGIGVAVGWTSEQTLPVSVGSRYVAIPLPMWKLGMTLVTSEPHA